MRAAIDMNRKSLLDASLLVDTVATRLTVPTRNPSVLIPQLGCSTRNGERYVRPPHVEDEIRRVLSMSREDCLGQAKSIQNETLVYFIRLTHESDDELCGRLTKELCKRVRFRTRSFSRELDNYDKEQFLNDLEIHVLTDVFTRERSREREILEIAFGWAVQRLARDEFEKFRNSTAGNIAEIPVDSTDEDWDGEEEVERPIEFLPDASSGPEQILLNLDMAEHRHQLLRRALEAISEPRHREAAILHWGHGTPVDTCKRGTPSLTRRFRKEARQIRYWLTTAMNQMRTALGIRERCASRVAFVAVQG
jgi:hypothetical protein